MDITLHKNRPPLAGARTPGALVAGGIAAFLASACCLGPLVLLLLGVSGAWIGNLALLEPYRPLFVGLALLCLALSWRPIYRPAAAAACVPGDACAVPRVRTSYRGAFWAVAALVLIALAYPYFLPMLY